MKLLVTLVLISIVFAQSVFAQKPSSRAVTLMGSRFDITVVAKDEIEADGFIDTAIAEITRIEYLISDWIATTQIAEVNKNAGIKAVKVDQEVFDLTKRAIAFSEITDGAFDISYAAMDKIWKFDGSMKVMPKPSEIEQAIANVGFRHLVLDSINQTIFLTKRGMKIGFGATGKGYAADRARFVLEQKGVSGGIINASGDITTWGRKPNGKPWYIGVTNPFDKENYMSTLEMRRMAVTTSGSYEKFVEFNGKRYAHIINPKTGYPATGLISATVIGPCAELANALSTSIMVLGAQEGLSLLNKFPSYQALLIADDAKVIKLKGYKWKVPRKL